MTQFKTTVLRDALADLKVEVLAGHSVKKVVVNVARDYAIHPGILERTFFDRCKSEDALRTAVYVS